MRGRAEGIGESGEGRKKRREKRDGNEEERRRNNQRGNGRMENKGA